MVEKCTDSQAALTIEGTKAKPLIKRTEWMTYSEWNRKILMQCSRMQKFQ